MPVSRIGFIATGKLCLKKKKKIEKEKKKREKTGSHRVAQDGLEVPIAGITHMDTTIPS